MNDSEGCSYHIWESHFIVSLFIYLFIYWGDTDEHNYTGFRCTIPQHTICTSYCVFTTPSKVFFHHHLFPIHPPPPPDLSTHHTVVRVHEFFLFFPFYSISPRLQPRLPTPPTTAVSVLSYISVCLYSTRSFCALDSTYV